MLNDVVPGKYNYIHQILLTVTNEIQQRVTTKMLLIKMSAEEISTGEEIFK